MTKKEVFLCDQCGVSSMNINERNTPDAEPPYVQGWRHLEHFEFKASQNYRHQTIRKHFCCTECMVSFLGGFIRAQEEALHNGTLAS